MEDKEEQLRGIMQVLDRQEAINAQIAERAPVIAWKSTQEEPQKPKRKGFLGLFGKKEKPKPTATSTMLYTLNRDMIARQKRQNQRLSEYADSLAARNTELNHSLSAGDVSNALISLGNVVCEALSLGMSVDLAELGPIRLNVSSKMMDTPEIVFTPKKAMRDAANSVELSIDRSRVTAAGDNSGSRSSDGDDNTETPSGGGEGGAPLLQAVEATRVRWDKTPLSTK